MKFATATGVSANEPDSLGALTICDALDQAREQLSDERRWLIRLERSERNAESDLGREIRRLAAGNRDCDPGLAERLFDQATTDAEEMRAKVTSSAGEILKLEGKILGDSGFVSSLESEVHRLEVESAKAQSAYEVEVLRSLAGLKANGNLDETREVLRTARQQIIAVNKALELAKSVIQRKRTQDAVRLALPKIEAAIARRDQSLSTVQAIDGEILKELASLKKNHGFEIAGGWPVENYKLIGERSAAALSKLQKEI